MKAALVAVVALAGCAGGGEADRYTLESRFVGAQEQALVVPDGGGRRPLLVLLHGRDGSPETFLVDELYDALDALGDRAPAVLALSGGDSSYWHDRRTGAWGRYVLEEAIPEAVRRGKLDGRRVAIGGISMGGFGALDLARSSPRRFCAVGGHSPALWLTGGETPQGAFDDAEDFERHDVLGAAAAGRRFGAGRVWLDVGRDDSFRAATEELARRLGRRAVLHVWEGSHTPDYNRGHFDEYLEFYARELEGCA